MDATPLNDPCLPRLAFPELAEHMDWILAALEVTEREIERA